jgi:hypothetical protein
MQQYQSSILLTKHTKVHTIHVFDDTADRQSGRVDSGLLPACQPSCRAVMSRKVHCSLLQSSQRACGAASSLPRGRSAEESACNWTTAWQNKSKLAVHVRVNICKARQFKAHLKHVAKREERLSCCELQKAGTDAQTHWPEHTRASSQPDANPLHAFTSRSLSSDLSLPTRPFHRLVSCLIMSIVY